MKIYMDRYMINNTKRNENDQFAQGIMERIHVIDKHIKTYGVDIVEKYYQKHGTYNGIEPTIKTIQNQSNENDS